MTKDEQIADLTRQLREMRYLHAEAVRYGAAFCSDKCKKAWSKQRYWK